MQPVRVQHERRGRSTSAAPATPRRIDARWSLPRARSRSRAPRRRVTILAAFTLTSLAACTTHPALGAIPAWEPVLPSRTAVAYGPHPEHLLDLYLPVDGESRGTLVYVHGGSFVGGLRESVSVTNPELLGLTALGWSVVTIDYRTNPSTSRIGSQVDDVRRALRWVQAHGGANGLDTSTVIVAGQSAGGSLVMLGASDPEQPWPADGWVAIAAVGDIAEWSMLSGSIVPTNESLVEMSPVAHVGDAATPGYVMHALADDVVPVQQAHRVVQAARSHGVSVRYDEIVETPWCHPHSATCGMDDGAFLDWMSALSAPVVQSPG
jgi:acetyl esterase/lipase